jgi:DNA repair exonuclease SbcCD ATPase subunit
MIIKKYLDFLVFEGKKQKWSPAERMIKVPRNLDSLPKDFTLKGLFTGTKSSENVSDELEVFVSNKNDAIKEVGKFVFDCKEEVKVLDKSIQKLKDIENKYWNFSTSVIYIAMIIYMIMNGLRVDQGAMKKAENSYKEVIGEDLNLESEKENTKKFKEESEKMRKEYEKKLNKLKGKIKDEKAKSEKLEEEKEELEKEKKKLKKENEELKEKERIMKVAKNLSNIKIKKTGEPSEFRK